MANHTHVKILLQGVNVWNRWRKNRPSVAPDLSGANLSRRNLTGANFENVNLNRSILTHATLTNANMFGASFEGTVGLS